MTGLVLTLHPGRLGSGVADNKNVKKLRTQDSQNSLFRVPAEESSSSASWSSFSSPVNMTVNCWTNTAFAISLASSRFPLELFYMLDFFRSPSGVEILLSAASPAWSSPLSFSISTCLHHQSRHQFVKLGRFMFKIKTHQGMITREEETLNPEPKNVNKERKSSRPPLLQLGQSICLQLLSYLLFLCK
jgi:hypothetical protein